MFQSGHPDSVVLLGPLGRGDPQWLWIVKFLCLEGSTWGGHGESHALGMGWGLPGTLNTWRPAINKQRDDEGCERG